MKYQGPGYKACRVTPKDLLFCYLCVYVFCLVVYTSNVCQMQGLDVDVGNWS